MAQRTAQQRRAARKAKRASRDALPPGVEFEARTLTIKPSDVQRIMDEEGVSSDAASEILADRLIAAGW